MDTEKKIAAAPVEVQEEPKQPYQTPCLTIHGTVQQITGSDGLEVNVPGASGYR
jgi:hypothetical protein